MKCKYEFRCTKFEEDEEIKMNLFKFKKTKDREYLEWLVYYCLISDVPPISTGRGKELLGFNDMQQMRDWMNDMADGDK